VGDVALAYSEEKYPRLALRSPLKFSVRLPPAKPEAY
jgi:hypothetical protein